jgi:hypothetical protein
MVIKSINDKNKTTLTGTFLIELHQNHFNIQDFKK